MLKFIQKLYDTGGIRIGGASHYTDIGTDGALTDVGTQSHNLNDVTIATLTATTVNPTNLTATAGSFGSVPRVGGATHYMSIGTTGALSDAGTNLHDLNTVSIHALTASTANVNSAASFARVPRIGTTSNYATFGTDGAITDTGTQSHDLNAVSITTLTNSAVSQKTRYMDLPATGFSVPASGSVTLANVAVAAGSYKALKFVSNAVTGTDIKTWVSFRAPADIQAACAMSVKVYSWATSANGSRPAWKVSASYYATGETKAGTTASAAAKDSTSASATNVPTIFTLGNLTAPTANDLCFLEFSLFQSSGSSTSKNRNVERLRIDYKSVTAL